MAARVDRRALDRRCQVRRPQPRVGGSMLPCLVSSLETRALPPPSLAPTPAAAAGVRRWRRRGRGGGDVSPARGPRPATAGSAGGGDGEVTRAGRRQRGPETTKSHPLAAAIEGPPAMGKRAPLATAPPNRPVAGAGCMPNRCGHTLPAERVGGYIREGSEKDRGQIPREPSSL